MKDPIAIAAEQQSRLEADLQKAAAAMSVGREALAFLEAPVVAAFFVSEAVEAYKAFLAPGADLLAAQARGIAINKLYEHLTLAVAKGRASAANLDAIVKQGGVNE